MALSRVALVVVGVFAIAEIALLAWVSQAIGLGWTLAILMLIVYYGYIALIAFDKEFLAKPIGAGVTSLGVPIGMGVIVFTIAITVYYVHVANSKFDALTEQIMKDVTK